MDGDGVHQQCLNQQQQQNQPNRTFGLFQSLTDELQATILGYVADAPFEDMRANSTRSALTHELPLVSKKFREYSRLDSYWERAMVRQVKREPFLWLEGLHRISGTPSRTANNNSTGSAADNGISGSSSSSSGNAGNDDGDAECVEDLVRRVHVAMGKPSFKSIYERVVSGYLRIKRPVFFMPGSVQLGSTYGLHLFEPRYRLMMTELMADQSDDAKRGGKIRGEVMFVHANRHPAGPTTPVVLVQCIRCELYPDGRADVLLLPVAHAWIEKMWARPGTGYLHYAQCMRMGQCGTKSMNKLARQEALVNVMDRLRTQFEDDGEEEEEEEEEDGMDSDLLDDDSDDEEEE